jgi:putative phosphoesterase
MRAADLILHGGDVATVAALEELRALGPPVHAVAGNVDEPALQAELPPELVVEVGQVKIAMTHIPGPARGREQRLRARFPSADAIVYGHTHMPQVDELGGVWILNPGSPTERRRAPARTMIVLEIRRRKIRPELLVVG